MKIYPNGLKIGIGFGNLPDDWYGLHKKALDWLDFVTTCFSLKEIHGFTEKNATF